MSTAKRLHYSYTEYLRALEDSDLKLEFCDGVIYAMAGGTPAHAFLGAAMVRILGQGLLGRCRVSKSDLKVHVEATGLSTFPDAAVICGELKSPQLDVNSVSNPVLLVEVTSPSTEDYDRGDKLSNYKQISSLRGVLFVSHRMKTITVVERAATGWNERDFRSGEVVSISEPAVQFKVDDIYSGVTLDPA
ncbi:MAG: Uma2 family endonuclease [Myxococcaceae bacterium]|nr:Uma2 family endonuclease [Myxococcaceae bacterium]